jgi:hypothetical protein
MRMTATSSPVETPRFYLGCFLVAASLAGAIVLGQALAVGIRDAAVATLGDAEAGNDPDVAAIMARRPPRPTPHAPTLIARAAETDGATPVRFTTAYDVPIGPGTDTDDGLSATPWVARAGTYRTVCVRLCDGTPIPVSFAATADRLTEDAHRCATECGTPARLYVGRPDGELAQMVDLAGRRYADLPTAFRFRTTHDARCTCRGTPTARVQTASVAPPVRTETATVRPPGGLATAWRLDDARETTTSLPPDVEPPAPASGPPMQAGKLDAAGQPRPGKLQSGRRAGKGRHGKPRGRPVIVAAREVHREDWRVAFWQSRY